MFKKLQISIVLVVIFVGASFPFSSFASICGCKPLNEEDALQKSDVAFYGVVEKLEAGDKPRETVWNGRKGFSWRQNVATFGIVKILKGPLTSLVVVETDSDGGMCGVDFSLGGCYAVYARRNEKDVLTTSYCYGTRSGCEEPVKDERISGTSEPWPQQELSNEPVPVLTQPSVPQDQNKAQYVHATSEPAKQPVNEESKLTNK